MQATLHKILLTALAAGALTLPGFSAITGTFVAAQDGVNTFQSVDGTSAFSSTTNTTGLWHERVGVFDIQSMPSPASGAYQGQNRAGTVNNPTSTEVVTTLTGLTPGVSYEIHMIFGVNNAALSGDQNIDAGFTSGSLKTMAEAGSTDTGERLVTGILPGDAALCIRPGTVTLATLLHDAGYATGVVGKWHLGLGTGKTDYNHALKPGPLEIGFDHSFIFPAPNAVFPDNDTFAQQLTDIDVRQQPGSRLPHQLQHRTCDGPWEVSASGVTESAIQSAILLESATSGYS